SPSVELPRRGGAPMLAGPSRGIRTSRRQSTTTQEPRMNNITIRKIALAALPTLALVSPLAAAGGMIEVINESPLVIQPYFKSNCWGFAVPAGTTGWVFFGGIGPD